MKKILLMVFGLLVVNASAQLRCVTEKKMEKFHKKSPQDLKEREDLYKHLSNANNLSSKNTQTVVTIPVVVHVLYKNATQNISDAQIASQIAVLNQDFRKANTDFINAPLVFRSVGADMQVMFCLATKDPNGNPTNGIVRKQVSSNFGFDDHYYEATGSLAWNNTKYLNVWVGKPDYDDEGGWSNPLSDIGTAYDGIAMNYIAFGTMGTAVNHYNKGRSLTHEVGHYLGLLHPFGAEAATSSSCGTTAVNDFCADTPSTYYPYLDSPTFPSNTYMCTPTSNGAMFMNFMDYPYDEVKVLFTNNQKTIVANTLAGPRASLLNSNACSVLATNEVEKVDRINLFPNPTTQYISIASPLKAIDEVEIFNAEGRLVKKASIQNETDKISVSDFASGIYFVRTYKDKNFIKSMKFIKK